jgi:hypothetical protein
MGKGHNSGTGGWNVKLSKIGVQGTNRYLYPKLGTARDGEVHIIEASAHSYGLGKIIVIDIISA